MIALPRALLVLGCLALVPGVSQAQVPVAKEISFARDVVPLLEKRCFHCHRGKDAESGIRLDLRADIIGESTGHPLVVARDSKRSRLIERVTHGDVKKRMPPNSPPLSDAEVATLRRWIDDGVSWDVRLLPPEPVRTDHWAFKPVRRPSLPVLPPKIRTRNAVDAFIAAKQQAAGVTFAPEADRRTLIRRLSFDLLGLPPAEDEVEAFVADERADAYERLVDRLLASPHYGERWGRHWLDVARWAESEGFEANHPRPFAWRYRDYVIDSFNRDRPFDEFLTQQVAGDELPKYTDENLIATGFLAAARISSNEEDNWMQRNDVNVDIVNMVGSGVLGMTFHCAQCHNHKFDPITARDYYQLQAFFMRGQPTEVRLSEPQHCRDYEAKRPADFETMFFRREALIARARSFYIEMVRGKFSAAERKALDIPLGQRTVDQELLARKAALHFIRSVDNYVKQLPAEEKTEYEDLKKRLLELEPKTPSIPQTFAFYSPVQSPHSLQVLPPPGFHPLRFEPEFFERVRPYVMIRGEVHDIGSEVRPGFPEVFATNAVVATGNKELRRTDLARWLTDRQNPLVSRVWANRVWHYHFGKGLVATTDDFGAKGSAPTHPELLDWLASELMDHGWSTKHLHRVILHSRAYRQTSRPGSDRDPENHLLTRFVPRRLEAEVMRDAMLKVSGELDLTRGGASVPQKQMDSSLRRTVYLFQKRGRAPDVQVLFDGPNECSASAGNRLVSTSPLQALYLLNGTFAWDRAKHLAKTIRDGAGDEQSLQLIAAFRAVLQRVPTAAEREKADKLLASDQKLGLALLCQALINLNEFAYVE